ncbi:MAG: hypothetical protein AAF078_06870 [Planctomycetota bacterium]
MADRPWERLPDLQLPIALPDGGPMLDDVVDMPPDSALTLARVEPTGEFVAWRWRGTGQLGFYPASSIKWMTAGLLAVFLDELGIPDTATLQTGDDAPLVIRDAVLSMLIHSSNETFNTLQEAVGFEETMAVVRAVGCERLVIRRSFGRDRRSHSRAVTLTVPEREPVVVSARLDTDLPLSSDDRPPPMGNPEANFATTDDFVRMAAWTLMGPPRRTPAFDLMPIGLAGPHPRDTAAGFNDLAIAAPDSGAFTVLSKPGWWPPEGVNVDVAYAYDHGRDRHYFASIYVEDTVEERARKTMRQAAHDAMAAVRDAP